MMILPDPPPEMTTFGLALDSSGDIWQYQGANGMVKLGSLAGEPPPVNVTPPQITVMTNLNVGSLLACNAGSWNPTGTYSRQWQSAGVNIAGATATSYTLQATDVGNMITCVVTATNAGGSASAPSNAVGPITEPA